MVAIQLRGIPFRVIQADIRNFFRGFRFYHKSIQFGAGQNGMRNGYAAILMQNEQEALNAVQMLDSKYLNNRFV